MKKRTRSRRPRAAQPLVETELTVVSGGGGDGNDTLIGMRGNDYAGNITLKRG